MTVNVQQALQRYRAQGETVIADTPKEKQAEEVQRQGQIEQRLGRILRDPEGLKRLLEENSDDQEAQTSPLREYAPNEVAEEKMRQRAEELRPLAEKYASILGQNVNSAAGQEVVERTLRFYSRNKRQAENFKKLVARLE